MKKLFVLLLTLALCSWVQADCGSCDADNETASSDAQTCPVGDCTLAAGECAGDCAGGVCECAISQAMAALPNMTYSVEGESVCCEHSAEAMAKAQETHMHYVVGKTEFDSKTKAMVALADKTEEFVNDFVTTHKCSVSGMTTVAGKSMKCGETAAKMAKVAKEAMSQVAMSYKVGDETCSCPNQAASLAKESGSAKEYVVAGETTCCSVDARIKLAKAKYRAALTALAKMNQEADSNSSASAEAATASQS